MRRNVGVAVLATSTLYSAVDLLGWLRPVFLRMRIHEGSQHAAAILLGSLTFKAIFLFCGILLTFWPERSRRSP